MERKEEKLMEIMAWAMSQALIPGLSKSWVKAYLRLSNAAFELVEMIDRLEVKENQRSTSAGD